MRKKQSAGFCKMSWTFMLNSTWGSRKFWIRHKWPHPGNRDRVWLTTLRQRQPSEKILRSVQNLWLVVHGWLFHKQILALCSVSLSNRRRLSWFPHFKIFCLKHHISSSVKVSSIFSWIATFKCHKLGPGFTESNPFEWSFQTRNLSFGVLSLMSGSAWNAIPEQISGLLVHEWEICLSAFKFQKDLISGACFVPREDCSSWRLVGLILRRNCLIGETFQWAGSRLDLVWGGGIPGLGLYLMWTSAFFNGIWKTSLSQVGLRPNNLTLTLSWTRHKTDSSTKGCSLPSLSFPPTCINFISKIVIMFCLPRWFRTDIPLSWVGYITPNSLTQTFFPKGPRKIFFGVCVWCVANSLFGMKHKEYEHRKTLVINRWNICDWLNLGLQHPAPADLVSFRFLWNSDTKWTPPEKWKTMQALADAVASKHRKGGFTKAVIPFHITQNRFAAGLQQKPQRRLDGCRRDALNFSHHRTTPKGVFDMVSLVMPSRLTLTESLHRYWFID